MLKIQPMHKYQRLAPILSCFFVLWSACHSTSYADSIFNNENISASGRLSAAFNTFHLEDDNNIGLRKDTVSLSGQESSRFMLDSYNHNSEWSAHIKLFHQHTDNSRFNTLPLEHSAFRYRQIKEDWDGHDNTFIGYDIDRFYYKKQIENVAFSIGRQAIDWGSGRFWQPMNVFGAFSPTDLDTDYKTGIDTVYAQYFPSPFSSLSATYVFTTHDTPSSTKHRLDKHNYALRYRTQIAENSELALLYADVLERHIIAASFESDWQGIGWRLETAHYDDSQKDNLNQQTSLWFWIAGIDYQFNNGALLSFEWYQNDFGLRDTQDINSAAFPLDEINTRPAQQQLGKQALGISLSHDLSPLLNLHYTGLVGTIKNQDKRQYSVLHQVNILYSVSDNSDLLFSVLTAQGKGKHKHINIRSDYGHIPSQATLRFRYFFGQS